MSYVDVINSDVCTGCMKCKNLCPQNAIHIERNKEGFDYPKIDLTKCVDCEICRTECIAQKKLRNRFDYQFAYAVQADESTRMMSSSGGIFTIIARYFLKNNGVVCGAAFVDNKVKHILVYEVEDLDMLRRSKYVQSDISETYIEVINCLKKGIDVLFVGTPCQCEAIISFCKENSEHLYTIDILCMGVPSPGMFEKYLHEEIGANVENINFRDKRINGWSDELIFSYEEKNEVKYVKASESSYFSMFLDGYALRKNCYDCKYAGAKRITDLTIGDFWGIGNYKKELDDNKGTSLVIVSSDKGKTIFEILSKLFLLCEEVPIDIAIKSNPILLYSTEDRGRRKEFFDKIRDKSLADSVNQMNNYRVDYGIINFWWADDNGGILTAYALQKTIEMLGYSSELIDLKTDIKTGGISEKFARKNLKVTKRVISHDDYLSLNDVFGGFIVGSDQVFRTEWVPDNWFLEFADDDKKKIAISASFGKDYIDVDRRRKIKLRFLLGRFDFVSVREKQGTKICRELGRKSVHVIDPVFYLSREEYVKNLNLKVNNDGRVVFVYFRDITQEKKKFYEDVAKRKKSTLFIADDSTEVESFLQNLISSVLVITDSYHAVCFSLIFNKKFICILNELRGVERFNSIIDTFELPQELFVKEKNITHIKIDELDYDREKVNSNIKVEAKNGIDWLRESLTNRREDGAIRKKLNRIRFWIDNQLLDFFEIFANTICFYERRLTRKKKLDGIVCFGAGQFGTDFVMNYKGKIAFFIDNSARKKWVKNIPVFAFGKVLEIMEKEQEIIVTTSPRYQEEIENQLRSYGFTNVKCWKGERKFE